MSIHNLSTQEGLSTAKEVLNKAYEKKYVVEIKRYLKKRSNAQNRYIHKCFQIIADDIGDTLENVKTDVKIELGYYDTTMNGNKKLKSTANMNTKAFSELTEKLVYWAWNFHMIKLESPEDYKGVAE